MPRTWSGGLGEQSQSSCCGKGCEADGAVAGGNCGGGGGGAKGFDTELMGEVSCKDCGRRRSRELDEQRPVLA